jgi:hypothetical protein
MGTLFSPGEMPPVKVIHPKPQILASIFHFFCHYGPMGAVGGEGAGSVGVPMGRGHGPFMETNFYLEMHHQSSIIHS